MGCQLTQEKMSKEGYLSRKHRLPHRIGRRPKKLQHQKITTLSHYPDVKCQRITRYRKTIVTIIFHYHYYFPNARMEKWNACNECARLLCSTCFCYICAITSIVVCTLLWRVNVPPIVFTSEKRNADTTVASLIPTQGRNTRNG